MGDWVACHPLLEKQNKEKSKRVVNITAEISQANSLNRHLTVISTLWYW